MNEPICLLLVHSVLRKPLIYDASLSLCFGENVTSVFVMGRGGQISVTVRFPVKLSIADQVGESLKILGLVVAQQPIKRSAN